jgi:prepilin-type N-terminal cleavage/methylation domain-containing protein
VRSLLAEEHGLTLAEVLAALTVLSIGIVAMISLLPLAGSGVHEGAQRTIATFLAAQRLEQIRHVVGLAETQTDPLGDSGMTFPDEAALAVPHAAFGRSVRLQDCGAGLGCGGVRTPGVRQITVTVTYPTTTSQGAPAPSRAAIALSTYLGSR